MAWRSAVSRTFYHGLVRMHSSFRSLPHWIVSLVCMVALFFAHNANAQGPQPRIAKTGISVAQVATGDTQLSGHHDILYVQRPVADSVTAGLLLSSGDTFADLPQNQLTFPDV